MVARGTIAELAAKRGIVLPDVKPKDFMLVASQVISYHLVSFAELATELESLRLVHSPIEHARSYRDILDLLDQTSRTIATLTKAAAALPLPKEELPVAPAAERVTDALADIRSRMGLSDERHCATCRCHASPPDGTPGEPIQGRIVDPSEGPQGPGATVLPLHRPDGPEGLV
jgi:hypothetical protein